MPNLMLTVVHYSKKLNILPFDELVKANALLFMSDFKNGRLPRSFIASWRTILERQNVYNLRNNANFDIPAARTEMIKRLPMCRIPSTWNNFSNENLKSLNSRSSFRYKAKKDLLNSLPTICNRLLCPSCHLNI